MRWTTGCLVASDWRAATPPGVTAHLPELKRVGTYTRREDVYPEESRQRCAACHCPVSASLSWREGYTTLDQLRDDRTRVHGVFGQDRPPVPRNASNSFLSRALSTWFGRVSDSFMAM